MKMYEAVAKSQHAPALDGSVLTGFSVSNDNRKNNACLTRDMSVRFHTCEFGTGCIDRELENVVYIIPTVGKTLAGKEVVEAGAASTFKSEAFEIDLSDDGFVAVLKGACRQHLTDMQQRGLVLGFLEDVAASDGKVLSIDHDGLLGDATSIDWAFFATLPEQAAMHGNAPPSAQVQNQRAESRNPKKLRNQIVRFSATVQCELIRVDVLRRSALVLPCASRFRWNLPTSPCISVHWR